MSRDDTEAYLEARKRHYDYKKAKLPFIIQPKTPVPPYMRYKCKCGSTVGDYTTYQSGAFYIFTCYDCGRIRRFTTLTHSCKFCGVKQELDDGMMHEHGDIYGNYWMCPRCANDGTDEKHREKLDKRHGYYDWGY